jgi:3-dehydroquinate synthase
MNDLFLLYGPPRSGKTTIGRLLAERLDLPFVDLDARLAEQAGRPLSALRQGESEASFRGRETAALRQAASDGRGVVALGDGALLAPLNRGLAEDAGVVLCLEPGPETAADAGAGDAPGAPARRPDPFSEHYASFPRRLAVAPGVPEENADAAQIAMGAFRVRGMGAAYDVRVGAGRLDNLGALLAARGWQGRAVIAGDEHTLPEYGRRALQALEQAGIETRTCRLPAGEAHKTIETVQALWRSFLEARLERSDTVVALGGGVVGDLAGFAASTWLRGVRWVGLPTTLLAMADSSLGGKTGADLPQGKNLVGAFHPPALVVADTDTLVSLPDAELRAGLAEAVKHGIIADPELFDQCAEGFDSLRQEMSAEFVSRAMAVKIRTIERDPYEKGERAGLNLGHTVGHGIEKAARFTLRHGEAVAMGLVAEARLAERMGLAHAGLADLIAGVLAGLGLPAAIPAGIDRRVVAEAIQLDKKRAGGVVRFALPVRIGEVRTGVAVDPALLAEVLG